MENILLHQTDTKFIFDEIANITLNEEKEVIRLKDILLSYGNAYLSRPDLENSKKILFKKLQENFLISFEIYSQINESPSLFVIIYKANLLEKLEICCNKSPENNSFLYVNQRFYEFYLDLIEYLIIKNNLQAIKNILVSRKNIDLIKNKKYLPIYKGNIVK